MGKDFRLAFLVRKCHNVFMGTTATATALVTVDASGRMVIPSKIRQTLGIEGGGELMVTIENGRLQLYSKAVGRQAARQAVRQLVSPSCSLAEELSADRENEAKREGV